MIAENTLSPVAHRILWLPGEDRHWDHDGGFGGRRNPSGVRVDPDTALQSTVVLACARVLAESVASLPLHLYRRLGDGGKSIAREHPLYRILHDQPNGWQTSFEWREQAMLHLCLHGNAYSEIRPGAAGSVSELVPLHPSRMRVERVEGGRLRYKYREEGGRETLYGQDAIMHLRWLSDDGVNGMVPVELARDAIGLARACEIHGASFFGNGARPGVILTTEQTIPGEAAETLRNNWERMHRGPDKAQRTAVLTGGLKPIELGGNNQEAQFLEARRFQVEEICRLYRVPPHLVGDLTRSSFSNIEQQSIDFVQHTLLGWLRRFESAFTRDLIVDDATYFVEFDTRGLLRGDASARASYYNTMHQLGVLSLNEIRAAENLNPVDGGDIRVVPLNMQTLEQANAAAQAAMAPAAPVVEEIIAVDETPAEPAPEATPEAAASEEPQIADVSLNGAQVSSLLEIVAQYNAGLLNEQGAKALIAAAFPGIPQATIDAIIAGTNSTPVVVPGDGPAPEPVAPAPEPVAASLPASRDCGTGAGGFKPGNKCAPGGDGGGADAGGGDSGGSVSPEKARDAAREMGVDPTDPKQVAAAVRMQGVIPSSDPLRSIMTRQMVDIPDEHTPGLAQLSSTTQGVDLVTEVRVPGGSQELELYGFYSPGKREAVLSGGNNIRVLGGGVLHHEIGHHVHELRMNDAGDKEWRSISGNGENARISAYARTSRGEHFCEAYSHYARGGSHRARLKSLEPKVYSFMQKLFRKNSKFLNPNGGLGSYDSTRWGD